MENPYEAIRKLKNGDYHYNFESSVRFLEQEGKKAYGAHFSIDAKDHLILFKMMIYAIGDIDNMKKYGITPHKGLLLSGPIGCGKTSLMNLMLCLYPPERRYPVLSTRDVVFRFNKEGYSVIQVYSSDCYRVSAGKRIPKVMCFDDLGVEQSIKYYGNDCNVMGEILLSRYDQFIKNKMITHLTTNLSASELEKAYGNRLRSRLREMFNLLSFSGDTKDKRQ